MSDIIKTSNKSFKFNDIPFIDYPTYIKTKSGKDYYCLNRSLSGNTIHSRNYQLSNRSLQARYMDLLISVNYFKFLGINEEIYREAPIINTDSELSSIRSYYLLDYFIPDLSLCIELDSNYHDENYDKARDLFMRSIGITTYRIYNFQIDTEKKLDSLAQFISSIPKNKFNIDYSYLMDGYDEYIESRRVNKLKLKYGESYLLSNKWRPIIEKLDKELIPGLLNNIIHKVESNITVKFSDLRKLYPLKVKEVRKYLPLINYLKGFNINLIITK
jgi:hypothetical protein